MSSLKCGMSPVIIAESRFDMIALPMDLIPTISAFRGVFIKPLIAAHTLQNPKKIIVASDLKPQGGTAALALLLRQCTCVCSCSS